MSHHKCNKHQKKKRKKTNNRMAKKNVHVQKKSLNINLKHHSKVCRKENKLNICR